MTREQLLALVWLRWRVRVNQLKRAGVSNGILLFVLAMTALLSAITLCVAGFLTGYFGLADASPAITLYVWDGLALVFLAFWLVGLMAELQRSDALALNKLLHLPVSPVGAFSINYLGSLFSLTLLLSVAAALGLSLGMVFARGAALVWLAPLLAAFFLMVTAVTNQFQGWLAALMANQRRRRMILMLVPMAFVIVAQMPNLFARYYITGQPDGDFQRTAQEIADLGQDLTDGKISPADYQQQVEAINRRDLEAHQASLQKLQQNVWLVSALCPPGWLGVGAMAAAEKQPATALVCVLGMACIGAVSLWRSYHTTLAIYSGALTAGRRSISAPAPSSSPTATPSASAAPSTTWWLPDGRIPLVSEQASAVASCAFRSLVRAPEVRMLLLSPLLMGVFIGPVLVRSQFPIEARPLLGFGAFAFLLMTTGQLLCNQFGFDRSGFQAFVLSGAPRRDILLGKNLVIAPITLGVGLLAILVFQAISPMRIENLLATPFQSLSLYLMFCLLANWLSMLAPMGMPAGTLRRPRPSATIMLLHSCFFFVLFPLIIACVLLPVGAQLLAERFGWMTGFPICLGLSVLECAAVVVVYRRGLDWQGDLLQAREQKILAAVRPLGE